MKYNFKKILLKKLAILFVDLSKFSQKEEFLSVEEIWPCFVLLSKQDNQLFLLLFGLFMFIPNLVPNIADALKT